MVAVARPDQQRDEVARLHGELFKWRDVYRVRTLRDARASRCRVPPRRSSSDHVTPFPHSGCACVTFASTRIAAVTGLRQPTAECSVGDGCTATLCGFIVPGTRTS